MTGGRRVRAALAAAGVLVLAAVAAGGPEPTTAAWTDAEVARASVMAATLASPRAGTCTIGVLSGTSTFTWLAPEPAPSSFSYEWRVLRSDGSVASNGTLTSSTRERQVSAALAQTTRTFQVRVVSGSWQSAWLNGQIVTVVGGLIGDCYWT
ncbi:hypothetical protein LQF12_16275 [Ruania suaedae]|uniref:hypothetical protein n=1 Tax=Ruania suaedae TaxID=2897774 RepID=UPI001E3486F0|nr:hypothetical protein [Ruania suaedae]UFU03017.1 hypothetical protein LQF12_16275 [Ruania suaedae]